MVVSQIHQSAQSQAIFDEFRSLGGIVENVRLGQGLRGRGLFAIDASRPVQIHVPRSLLFPAEDVLLVEGKLRLSPSSDEKQSIKKFFEHYQNSLSWSGGGRAGVEAFLGVLSALSKRARSCLIEDFALQHLFAPHDEQAILKRFLQARQIGFDGRSVLMPVLELANHSYRAASFEMHFNSIGVSGTFPDGEVVVCYNSYDTWQRFVHYGFVTEERSVYSLPINIRLPTGCLSIGIDPAGHAQDGYIFPIITVSPARISMSHLLLGDRSMPHAPRRIFAHALRETGLTDLTNLFDRISHYNRKAFLKLIASVEDQEGFSSIVLRRLARLQLEALSFVMEGREL